MSKGGKVLVVSCIPVAVITVLVCFFLGDVKYGLIFLLGLLLFSVFEEAVAVGVQRQ